MGNKRIALNTFFTVGQSLIAMACGLFTGRWVLNALGHDGFGVFSVVGGVMVFVLFLNSVLTNSACRHFAFAIGKIQTMPENDRLPYLGQWFTASLYVHLILPIILCGLGYFVGEWFIANKLVVAESMRGECFWVFRFSLISAFFSIVSAPYFALYTAKQLIFVRTIFSLGSTILNAFGSYALFFFAADRIFWHALILMAIQVLTAVLITLFAMVKFPETRLLRNGTKFAYVRELFTFGGAQMIGMFGNMMRAQGMAIVVNHFSGLKINAGQAIGDQVTSKSSIFSTALMGAILPEITTCLSAGKQERAFNIGEKINLFVPLSLTLIITPILVCIHPILVLWLKNPPEYAVAFCGIGLFTLYLDSITGGYQQIINANGKIVTYQICMGILLVSSVFVSTACYLFGFSAVISVGCGALIPTACTAIVRLYFVQRLFHCPVFHRFKSCLMPNLIILGFSYFMAQELANLMGHGIWQFGAISIINLIFVILLSMIFLSRTDLAFAMEKIKTIKTSFRGRTS